MAIVVPNVGERAMLTTLIAEPHRVRLFKNDITPDEGDVIGDYTEADFDGYGSYKTAVYGTPATSSGTSFVVGGSLFWQHDGGATSNTIYGYYVTQNDDTTLLRVERFGTPKTMAALSDIIHVIPRMELA